MAAYIYKPLRTFEEILQKAEAQGRTDFLSNKSIVWLQNYAKIDKELPQNLVREAQHRFVNARQLQLGSLYLFIYDAKHKETLPYFDRFPMVMPFDAARTSGRAGQSGGFMGLNFHYLPPQIRARLFDAMLTGLNNDKWDQTTRFEYNWRTLKVMSQHPLVVPCVKQYLFSHVLNQGKFVFIDPREWQMALFLPLQRFFKNERPISAQKVWEESIKAAKKIRRKKT